MYEDQNSKSLTRAYDPETCPDRCILSTLENTNSEIGAQKFLAFSKFYGSFVGLERKELMDYLSHFYVDELEFGIIEQKGFLRINPFGKVEILFLTIPLLIN